jgi:membrane protease YdiL (CAAX protease family)
MKTTFQPRQLKQLITDWQFYLVLIVASVALFFYQLLWRGYSNFPNSVWFYLQFLLLYPVLEEYVFRGHLQRVLARSIHFYWANIITSFVFVLLHLYVQQQAFILLGIFISSLVFGYFYHRYQSFVVSSIMHGIYNFLFLLFAANQL